MFKLSVNVLIKCNMIYDHKQLDSNYWKIINLVVVKSLNHRCEMDVFHWKNLFKCV